MKTVLVVDDEVEVCKTLRRLLRRDFNVELASSAAEAIACLERRPVDLVLSDYRMPEMNGAELLALVKQRWPSTARVMLSGYADINSLLAAVNTGEVVRFVRKPWDDVALLSLLRRLISARDLAAALYQPFRVTRSGAEAQIAQTETSAQVVVKMTGVPFDRTLALELIRRFLGAVDETALGLVGGLLEQHEGKLSFVAEVGGQHQLTLELPLQPPATKNEVPQC